jgi:excinuclease UvrABC nuclease subunit
MHSGLGEELRRFVGDHPHGWGHDEWLNLLEYLRARGHDIHDSDAVGALLERQRLIARLREIDGIGPLRVRALSDRYGSLWNLAQADPDELTQSARMPRGLAERIRSKL